MWVKLVVIATAAFIGWLVSVKLGIRTLASNREVEWPENETATALSPSQFHWTIVHVRDDIGGIYSLLILTNTLLAGVLAALVTLTQ
jgi:hypothetical protein